MHMQNRQLWSLFDQSISNCADHTHLIGLTSSKFLIFYNVKKDHDRLVIIIKLIYYYYYLLGYYLSKVDSIQGPDFGQTVLTKKPTHYILFRMLVLCLESLFGDPNQPLAPPLRQLEGFTSNVQHSTTLRQKLLHNSEI